MSYLSLGAASVLVAAVGVLVWRRPLLALYAFVIGLILNNTVFLGLFAAGARGWQLTAAQAWKEALLLIALARTVRDAAAHRSLNFRVRSSDVAAAAFVVIAVLYAVVPQHIFGGHAGPKAVLYGLRHYLLPVAAYFVGRSILISRRDIRQLAIVILVAAAVSAVAGIVEEYSLSVEQWHRLGTARFYTQQLGFPKQHGPGGLPENFAFNSADGIHRRLFSFFLSPLGSAYFFLVALVLAAAGLVGSARRALVLVASGLAFAGLLFTFTRSALAALPLGLVLLALATHRRVPLALAAAAGVVAIGFAAVFTDVTPRTHFLRADLPYQYEQARKKGKLPSGAPLETTAALSDPSVKSHLTELRVGTRSLLDHPQGYGVGNSGQVAARFAVVPRAGESFYLELGADVGAVGLFAWLAFSVLTLWSLFVGAHRREDSFVRSFAGGIFAAGVAVAALAVISDVWGAPWLAYVLWWLSGSALTIVQTVEQRTESTSAYPRSM
jgi:O-Antigen ligase